MAEVARQLVPRDVYDRMERDGNVRHEWVGGSVFAMVGASGDHNRIALRLAGALDRAGPTCRVFASDMRLMVEDAGYYPDVMVACGESPDRYFETAPCLLAEVLSPSTRDIDRREKRAAYLRIGSLRHYLVIEQDDPRVEHHHRPSPDAPWELEVIGPGDRMHLSCPTVDLDVESLFRGIITWD